MKIKKLTIALVFGMFPLAAAKANSEIARLSLHRTETPITINGTFLALDLARPQHAVMQIASGSDVQMELLLSVDSNGGLLTPVGEMATDGAAVWVWGTNVGLRAASGYLASARQIAEEEIAALPMGISDFSAMLHEDPGSYEATILIDMGKSIVLLLYHADGLAGAHYVSTDPLQDPVELIEASLDLIAQQQMGKINAAPGAFNGDGEPIPVAAPTVTCCSIACPTCCCTSSDACSSGQQCADCGTLACACSSGGCHCGQSPPGDQCLNTF